MSRHSIAVVGIDPGLHGAIALCVSGRILSVDDMPLINTLMPKPKKKKKTAKKRRRGRRSEVDVLTLRDMLQYHRTTNVAPYAFIEEPSAHPGRGCIGNFKSGLCFGVALTAMALIGPSLQIYRVRPQAWKKFYGLIKKDKQASLVKARRLFPNMEPFLARKSQDVDRAEAMLIAHYGYLMVTGKA